MVSDSLFDVAGDIWDVAGEVAPAGSVGNLVRGVIGIPASLVVFVGELFWGFGS